MGAAARDFQRARLTGSPIGDHDVIRAAIDEASVPAGDLPTLFAWRIADCWKRTYRPNPGDHDMKFI